jgi:antitoxin MazE
MEARLQKWGNSVGIRIPNSLLKSLNLSINDKIDLKEDGDRIIITKSKKERVSLEELFKNYNGENLAKEFEWDDPVGNEIW